MFIIELYRVSSVDNLRTYEVISSKVEVITASVL